MMQRQVAEELIEVLDEQVADIPVPQVIKAFNVFSQSRVQQRIMEPITETLAVSLAEEIVEAIKAHTQEEINCCLKEDQSEISEDAPLPSMPQEQIQERIVQKTNILVPRMIEKPLKPRNTFHRSVYRTNRWCARFSESRRNCRGDPTYSARPNVQSRRSANH